MKYFLVLLQGSQGFPSGSVVKNLPAVQVTRVRFLGWEDPLATHSSILVWKIPWTEEPGRLQSIGLQELEATTTMSIDQLLFFLI